MRLHDTSAVHMTRDDTSKERYVIGQIPSGSLLAHGMTHMTRLHWKAAYVSVEVGALAQ